MPKWLVSEYQKIRPLNHSPDKIWIYLGKALDLLRKLYPLSDMITSHFEKIRIDQLEKYGNASNNPWDDMIVTERRELY